MKDWTGNRTTVAGTLGASNHSERERASGDFYATDPKAIPMLESVLPLRHKVWECACGAGHLAKELEARGHDVLATDLADRGFGLPGWDFLGLTPEQWEKVTEWAGGEDFDIVTNPPYKYATTFVVSALRYLPRGGGG